MRAVRWAVAAALWAAGAYAAVLGARLPMEMGGLVLGPLLLGVAAVLVMGGLALVVPRRRLWQPRESVRLDSPRLVALAAFLAAGGVLKVTGVI